MTFRRLTKTKGHWDPSYNSISVFAEEIFNLSHIFRQTIGEESDIYVYIYRTSLKGGQDK